MFLSSQLSVNVNAQFIHISKNDSPISPDYQFFLMQEGSAQILFHDLGKEYSLHANDLIMIPPRANITCKSLHTNTLLSIRIDHQYMESLIPFHCEIRCNSTEAEENSRAYRELSDTIFQICSAIFTRKSKLFIESLLYKFSYQIQEHFLVPLEAQEKRTRRDKQTEKRVAQLKEYLQRHYQEGISLRSLAEEFYLSPQYLSKYFKKHFGISFSSYLTNLRLEYAMAQLVSTQNTITHIALENGFSSVTSFIRIFRHKYLVSPGRYRQEHAPAVVESLPQIVWNSEETANSHQTISVNVNSFTEYQKPWSMGINVGPFSNTLRGSFYQYFKECQDRVSVTYLRVFNVLDPAVLPFDSVTGEYDFTNLDTTLAFLKHNHVYPFIELSYKPPKGFPLILENPSTLFQAEKSMEYYCHALHAFLQHSVNTFGIDYVENWRFEVWHKCGEDLIPLESPQQYLEKYRRYRQTLHEIVPKCKIGGPGFNICGNKEDFEKLLTELDKASLPMDYVTFSAFPYHLRTPEELADPSESSTLGFISPAPDHIGSTFQEYQEILQKTNHFHQIDALITEFCATLTTEPYIAASLFPAAFLCKNMLDLSQTCKGIFYSYLMDAKLNLSKEEGLTNYLGLILENGIPKPALHAYHFLNLLGNYLVDIREGYILTRDSPYHYQLLCYNYTHFSRSYCFNSWNSLYVDNIYSAFEPGETRVFRFRCTHVPSGNYKVNRYSLNHRYGSILDQYIHILEQGNIPQENLPDIMANFREEERDYYRKTCIPLQDIYFLKAENEFSINVSLSPHEICFYEFSRIL